MLRNRPPAPDKGEAVQLPLAFVHGYLWKSKSLRPAPNPVLRGGLFGVSRRGSSAQVKDYLVYEDKNIIITYDGWELGQPDLDVWLALVQKAGQRFLDQTVRSITVELTPSEFLREIGRMGGKHERIGRADRDWLVDSLKRLKGVITIKTPDDKKGRMGGLIDDVYWNDDRNRIVVEVNNIIGYLFAGGYSCINMDVRKKLMGDDLSLWLHNFITSHKSHGTSGMFYSLQKIQEKCRSTMKEMRYFRHLLLKKMERIMQTKTSEDFYEYEVTKDNILWAFYSKSQYFKWCSENGENPKLRRTDGTLIHRVPLESLQAVRQGKLPSE